MSTEDKIAPGRKGLYREMGQQHAVEMLEDRSDVDYKRYYLRFESPAVDHEVSAKRGFEGYVGWSIQWK